MRAPLSGKSGRVCGRGRGGPSKLVQQTHHGNKKDFRLTSQKNCIRKPVFQIFLKIGRSHFFRTSRTSGGWWPGPAAMGGMFGKIRILELGPSEVVHPGI